MRINKYLASQKYCTRREADELIAKGRVTINGRRAVLGDKILETDTVDVRYRPRAFRYFAYYKPRGVITHSPQSGERDIAGSIDIQGVFPIGRLDKDSYGLILLTDDGRLTDALLNPDYAHEKEYEVTCTSALPGFFKKHLEAGVDIEGYRTRPSTVRILGDKKFSIVLTEGKKHQIRRMCAAFGLTTSSLKRVRIMNIRLGGLKEGTYRELKGAELEKLRAALGISR
jgi:23S rRNA pseudouridine2604 synthase